MPLFIDVHRGVNLTPAEIAQAHDLDLQVQGKYGVKYTRYWHDPESHSVNCLVEAPDIGSALRVHREAHGLMPDEMIEVASKDVDRFFGPAKPTRSGTDPSDRAFRAIMFTDIVGSTRLTGELGDVGFHKLLRLHNELIRDQLGHHAGREIKHTGDGFLAAFDLASNAVECGTRIQQAFATNPPEASGETIRVKIGLSAGEPVYDHEDLFGTAVQLAARLCASAEGGQILASQVVRDLCIGKSFNFTDLGDAELKGFDEPVRIHEVAWSNYER